MSYHEPGRFDWEYLCNAMVMFVIAALLLALFLASGCAGNNDALRRSLAGADVTLRGMSDAVAVAANQQCAGPIERCLSSGSDPKTCEEYEACADSRKQWLEPASKLLNSAARMLRDAETFASAGDDDNANRRILAAVSIIKQLREALAGLGVLPQ